MKAQVRKAGAIVRNSLRPAYAPEVGRKLASRVRSAVRRRRGGPDPRAWAAEMAEPVEPWALALDAALWREAEAFGKALVASAALRRPPEAPEFGGAGDYRTIYFLVRHLRPNTVVETGVASGYTSAAILTALDRNGSGSLYSSDFPLVRAPNPERFIGWVVPEELRRGWHLHLRGDRVNLPAIAARLDAVDLLHYDSDKTYEGRAFALRTLGPLFHERTAIVFDDIQDTLHFRDWVESEGRGFRVFEFGGKFLGLVGPVA